MPKLFVVGGAVRDSILGIISKDIDYTFVLDDLEQTVEQGFDAMTKYMQDNKFEIFLSTPDCFTIRAKFPKGSKHEKLVADFVMARKETGYIEGTRRPILVLGTLEDDLLRRDFTVNAMAEDENGKLIDLFGGKIDLFNRILKTPQDPNLTMMDDPLRFLRCLRFSITKGFEIDRGIWLAMISNTEILEKLEKVVSPERIRDELFKMFKSDTIAAMKLLMEADRRISPDTGRFMKICFGKTMWLKPTFEQ